MTSEGAREADEPAMREAAAPKSRDLLLTSHYEILEVDPAATRVEIEAAYHRAIRLVEGQSVGGYAMLDPEGREAIRKQVEDAYQVLRDPLRRDRYDRELFEHDEERFFQNAALPEPSPSRKPQGLRFLAPVVEEKASPTAETRVPNSQEKPPGPADVRLEGKINGQTIRNLREQRGLTIDDVVRATKIRPAILVAIEEHDFAVLPTRVYLRGFMTQIARVLRVDGKRLAEGYLAFADRYGDPR